MVMRLWILLAALLLGWSAIFQGEAPLELSDIVYRPHNTPADDNRFLQFAEHVAAREADGVRIISYTAEGDPIYLELVYRREELQVRVDPTADQFGHGQVLVVTCSPDLQKIDGGVYYEYRLTGCLHPGTHTAYVMPK
ncbi:uncharacterized protein DUF4362 [Tumebacillus sp. BK434]|uniref:DUF4362 domain-containing protein n=1 Tax=Tumebacillus sp. BK434 TaxID=2512169 RepID=UPI0010EE9037|nr:DUF4362 domain-containing protein [Tumebacillus sp. BK434]TCP54501.1 uncharacterized protein DUF4362 [Tumebacillus sp. BK434]